MSWNDVFKFIVMTGWVLLLGGCFTMIFAVLYMSMKAGPGVALDDNLWKMAALAVGFLFGNLPTLLKDIMNKSEEKVTSPTSG